MIWALAQIDGLHVSASRSVFIFKDRVVPLSEIGETLGVGHVLDGTVSRVNRRLRVTAQLIDIPSGVPIWASRFDQQAGDVFRIQQEISRAVVRELKLELGIDARFQVANKTNDLTAYEFFLKGRLKFQNEQPGMRFSGAAELEEAIRLAPDFPDAQGQYALVRTLNSISEPYRENQARIRRSFESAFASNPFQAEALVAKAIAARWEAWNWPGLCGAAEMRYSLATLTFGGAYEF